MGEKTEKATSKKLNDARKKGQVAKSKDFPSAFTFIVSISTVLALSQSLYIQLSSYMIQMFALASTKDLNLSSRVGAYLYEGIFIIFSASIPIMGFVCAIGVLVNFLIIGPVFSAEAMKLDLKKLNPVTNLKNIFKIKTLVELIKSILKIAGASIIIYLTVRGSLQDLIATANISVVQSAMLFSDFLQSVIIHVGIFFILVGTFDLAFQKRQFSKEMMMEKHEIKQEYKNSEGDPHIKQKRKEIAKEIAYQEGPGATSRSKAVVTNSRHIAVAIEYEAEDDIAPKIATMGADILAEEIINIALDKNIPIMRNIALANTLYLSSQIGDFIPEESYEAIAEVLKWVEQLEEDLAKPQGVALDLGKYE